jgi:outer membrane protein TolC
MIVKWIRQIALSRGVAAGRFAVILAVGLAMSAWSQRGPIPSSAQNPFFGSVTAQPRTSEIIKLSLDDAVRRGLEYNLGLKQSESQEEVLHGQRNQALQLFLPTITLTGDTGFYQHDLAALGFGPNVAKKFTGNFPGGSVPTIPLITKDTLTQGQIHYSQTLFSGSVIAGWKAAGAAERAAHFGKMTARGEVVQQVATAYLHAIAALSEVDNAKALVAQSQVLLNNAHASHEAGVVANIDEVRAKVQLQSQQQLLLASQNQYEKDLILLKREIGLDPGQDIALSDPTPYSDLVEQTPEEVRAVAYKNRQDYQNLQNLAVGYKAIHAAYRSQRFPTLQFNSYYGTSTVNGAGTHGNFLAMGTLSVPIFREAGLRGNEDASQAQLSAVNAQLADLRIRIDQQVRSALLDVAASKQLVEVSRSNVELATSALSDVTERVKAGVDENLPLVTAQATLALAESNLVQSTYRYNVSKLALARAAGVLELQYRDYIGK